jgi:trk system potassium uptake protein TrkA
MKQFAIIGLSRFGRRLLEEFLVTDAEMIIIDKDRDVIELYKDKVASAYIADVLNEEIIRKLIPPAIDAAIVDLGERIEGAILVTNYLKKLGVKEIIARAEGNEHGEILELVGATKVVFPNQEAAKRIAPFLISSQIFSYLPISAGLVIAEVKVPEKFYGKSLVEVDMRRQYNLNVIAYRKLDRDEYFFYAPEYRLQGDDILLVGGGEEDIDAFTEEKLPIGSKRITGLFRRFFSRKP